MFLISRCIIAGVAICVAVAGCTQSAIQDVEKSTASQPAGLQKIPPPANAVEHFEHGDWFGNHKQYQEAIKEYDEAIRIFPTFGNAFYGRGLSYQNLGNNEKALADYTEAIRMKPRLAEAYNNRGLVYQAVGQKDKAIADLQTAYEKFQKAGDKTGAQCALTGLEYVRSH